MGPGGLGEAIARAWYEVGHTVLVTHSPGNDHVQAWLAQQAATGYQFQVARGYVADADACQGLARQIDKNCHGVDILVNNGGIIRDATLRKLSHAN